MYNMDFIFVGKIVIFVCINKLLLDNICDIFVGYLKDI